MKEATFAGVARGGEAISRQAREAYAAWESNDVESCLDSLEGVATDAESIAKRARSMMSELELSPSKALARK